MNNVPNQYEEKLLRFTWKDKYETKYDRYIALLKST